MKKNIIIITGASSGFGTDFAIECDKLWSVDEFWLIARRKDRLDNLASRLKQKAVILPYDLTSKSDINKIASRLKDEPITIKLLINNAGYGRVESFENSDFDYIVGMIDLNIRALVELTHIALPYMFSGSGIINLSSSASFTPMPNFAVYAATKSFVLNFSYALREELAPRGIVVTAVCPGPAQTEFFKTDNKKQILGVPVAPSLGVVKLALKDYQRGKAVSVYGTIMRLNRYLTALLPRFILAKIAKRLKL